jgi:hypothetical protein
MKGENRGEKEREKEEKKRRKREDEEILERIALSQYSMRSSSTFARLKTIK